MIAEAFFKPQAAVDACTYNKGIDCDCKKQNCFKCGWNPKVESKRMRNIKRDMILSTLEAQK